MAISGPQQTAKRFYDRAVAGAAGPSTVRESVHKQLLAPRAVPERPADAREVNEHILGTFLKRHMPELGITSNHKNLQTVLDHHDNAFYQDPRGLLMEQILTNLSHDAIVSRYGEKGIGGGEHPDLPDFEDIVDYLVVDKNKFAYQYTLDNANDWGKDQSKLKQHASDIWGQLSTPEKREIENHYAEHQREAAEKAHAILRHALPATERTRVQTAHPTEVLSDEAILAFEALRDFLKTRPIESIMDPKLGERARAQLQLSNLTGEGKITTAGGVVQTQSDEGEKNLDQLMLELWNALGTPPSRKMTAMEEVERGLHYARGGYEAVPEIMYQHRSGLRDLEEKYGLEPISQQHPTLEDLRNLYSIVDMESWAGSDQDNKPAVTAKVLQEALNRNVNQANEWYLESLTHLLEDMAAGLENQSEDEFPVYKKAISELEKVKQTFIANPQASIGKDLLPKMEDFKVWAEKRGVEFPPQINKHGEPTGFSELDVLIVQMGNFENQALRQQVRQNRDMHHSVFETVLERLQSEQLIPDTLNIDDPEAAVNAMMDNPETRTAIHAFLIQELQTLEKERFEKRDQARQRANTPEELARLDELERIGDGDPLDDPERENLYHVLSTMKVATDNPDKVPQYLIAEATDEKDLFEAFFMLKAIANPEIEQKRGVIELSTLTEHRHDIELTAQTNNAALENTHFRNHMVEVSKQSPDLLRIFDPEQGEKRPLTVADVKRRYGMKILGGDDTREIEIMKTVMNAGSDSFRGSGPGMAVTLTHAQHDTIESGLEQDPPVFYHIYMGGGGAVQRNNPSFWNEQTVQGITQRINGPLVIARKAVAVITNTIGKTLGNEQPEILPVTGQVAAGNMLTGHRRAWPNLMEAVNNSARAGELEYEKDLRDPRMAEYMTKSSAAQFVKAVGNFSARKDSRIGHDDTEETYPKQINPEKLRAIGYGLSFFGAGSHASLYNGITKILRLVDGQLDNHHIITPDPDKEGGFIVTPNTDPLGSKKGNLATIAETLKRVPEVQDEMLRMACGMAFADMEVAWKFHGAELLYDEEKDLDHKGHPQRVKLRDGSTHNLSKLATMYDDGVGLDGEDPEKIDPDSPVPPAILVMAKFQREYQQGIDAMFTLLNEVNKDLDPEQEISPRQARNLTPRERLLAAMPEELAQEIQASDRTLKVARNKLSDYHEKFMSGQLTMPKLPVERMTEREEALYKDLHATFGVLVEFSERAPAALREPGIGRAITDIRRNIANGVQKIGSFVGKLSAQDHAPQPAFAR